MKFKECYVSKNGISCITDINTLHNYNKITINNNFKDKIIVYLVVRCVEFVLTDFFKNCREIEFNKDDYLIQSISFS